MEHNRYVSQRFLDGWQYGEVRVQEAKINPTLIPWPEMPSERQISETKTVQIEHQDFALKSDQFTKRNYTLGVSGHRLHKLDVNNQQLQQNIRDALLSIREQFPDRQFIVLSPLAEGADRLVAKIAMETLDASLHVALPLPFDLYESDFTTPESVEEFKQMVGKAKYYYEVPMRFGNIRELAVFVESNEARNKQYALTGAYVIQRCDRLIAVWDGKPESGTGGTGQIVRWYTQGNIDPEYQYPDDYFLPSLKEEVIVLEPNP